MALNVLLVDDEYLVLKGLEIILSEQTETSVKIVTAMDVEDALNKLTSFRPDVIITDINMPESNGFELIKQAQQISHTADSSYAVDMMNSPISNRLCTCM